MPQFLATAEIEYSYYFDADDTERYIETHLIEADDANQAEAAIEHLYRLKGSEPTKPGFGPSYSAHEYNIKKLRITPFLNASELLAHTRYKSQGDV